MKKTKLPQRLAQGFILLSAFSLLSVSVMAFMDPQAVMNLVSVKLSNADAFSSIRGVYGGVGLTLFLSLIYLLLQNFRQGLAFLSLLWGLYAVSRLITIFAEGALGSFGQQWLFTESAFCLIALALLFWNRNTLNPQTAK